MIKAFSYLRVSGLGQIKGHGFTRQRQAIKQWASENGYEVVAEYKEEGVSGTNDEAHRPKFAQMVQEILANGVTVILIESLDRLAREYRIQESLVLYLASKETTLISCATGEDVTQAVSGDPMKKALIQIQGVFSELEKGLLVEKLRKSREAMRKETGRCEGRKPFGSTPEEHKLYMRIVYLRRKPRGHNKKKTCQEIADLLNSEGVTTRYGKKWTANRVWQVLNLKK